ncbi:hypothetical protein GCM10010112_69450 [Actinoplanes lobatus]|uniref:Putative metal-dependent peptidase n=1 Tax=Actinoplanes lobatus TaxID=113568 RepID=A0A7W7MK30_9ACTN|nr:VWA-like domain-containing protein [Actinoplanes lobatus]MBB4753078.1 putative metal-dependent peptidase [Actinoplanes lobatus]GGN87143.1 hypothetical protein GCM10010112_69450 [Actinoplanes lobatus]GIE39685.1 hypothetical protein Alo02nite_25830 [Actinoplanes lobatus]
MNEPPGARSVRAGVDAAARDLLIREPFFGHLLVGTIRSVGSGGAAVRLVPTPVAPGLEIGTGEWSTLAPAARTASLKHELLHLALKHPLRGRTYASRQLWDLACDLVVNQLMDVSGLPGAITAGQLRLSPDRSADEYYELLREPFLAACHADGTCNSAVEAIRRWLTGPGAARHQGWPEFNALPSATLSTYTHSVDSLVASTVRRARRRGWGSLPAALVARLESVGRPPEIPWQRVLRLFGATSERTFVRNVLSRPSKRYGTAPGTRVRRRTRLVVAVDTSGSVSTADIAAFFAEIHGMWRRGADITVLEADAEVHREYQYRGRAPAAVTGRGGTCLRPVLLRANELAADGLVYLTDGHAPSPCELCVRPRMPVLWVLTADGVAPDASRLPGRKTRLTRPART